MGAVAEDQTQEHHQAQDGARGEDLGPPGAGQTDLQLCFITLTPLYYRLRDRDEWKLMGDSLQGDAEQTTAEVYRELLLGRL